MNKLIKVWQFEDAPTEYQKLSQNGGDEDWIVLVPEELEDIYISWLYHIDTCTDPQKFSLPEGTIYIGSHA